MKNIISFRLMLIPLILGLLSGCVTEAPRQAAVAPSPTPITNSIDNEVCRDLRSAYAELSKKIEKISNLKSKKSREKVASAFLTLSLDYSRAARKVSDLGLSMSFRKTSDALSEISERIELNKTRTQAWLAKRLSALEESQELCVKH